MRKLRLFDGLGLLAVVGMLVFWWSLYGRYATGFGELDVTLSQADLEAGFREGYEVHALYLGSQKVGTLRTEKSRMGSGYRMVTVMDLVLGLGGQERRVRNRVEAELDGEFRLQAFSLESRGGPLALQVEGRYADGAMVVSGLGVDAERIAMPEAPFILPSLRPLLMRRNLARGDRVTFTYYDPLSRSEIQTDYTYLGQEEIEVMGRLVEGYHFRQNALGYEAYLWVNALGEVLMEELPLGFLAVREPEAEALYGLRGGDAVSQSWRLAQATGRAAWPGAYVKVEGLRFAGAWVLGPRQWSQGGVSSQEIWIAAVDAAQIAACVEAAALVEASSGTEAVVDSRDAMWRGNSAGVDLSAGGWAMVWRRARAVGDWERLCWATQWVHEQIQLDVGSEDESGTVALREGRGGHVAKAQVLVGLLRSVEVPARLVYGALLVGEEAQPHLWVEAKVGGVWVALDPLLGQCPADGSHLRLAVGGVMERILAWEALLGARFEVIEVWDPGDGEVYVEELGRCREP